MKTYASPAYILHIINNHDASSPIQTVLSVLDSHQIMLYGSRTCPIGYHRRSGIPSCKPLWAYQKKSPCPEEHYLFDTSILLL